MYTKEQLKAMAGKISEVCELHESERNALAEGSDVECDQGYWGAITGIAAVAERNKTIGTVSQGDAWQANDVGIFEIDGVVVVANLFTERYGDDDFDAYLTFEIRDEPFDQVVKNEQLGAAKNVVRDLLHQFDPDTVRNALNEAYDKAEFGINAIRATQEAAA